MVMKQSQNSAEQKSVKWKAQYNLVEKRPLLCERLSTHNSPDYSSVLLELLLGLHKITC